MRTLLLTTAAALVITGAATAGASAATKPHHYREAQASVAADDAAPADTMNAHDAYMKNLHDSGYNPHNDIDAHGNVKAN